jgi:hypothetical protein
MKILNDIEFEDIKLLTPFPVQKIIGRPIFNGKGNKWPEHLENVPLLANDSARGTHSTQEVLFLNNYRCQRTF